MTDRKIKACRKVPLEKIQVDLIIARNLSWKRGSSGKSTSRREIRAYYCHECQAWHTTSKPFTKNKERKPFNDLD